MADTQYTFGGRLRPRQEEPTGWENLVDLPNELMAFIYQRLSSHEQVKKSIYSVKAQDALVDLAKEDGYSDHLIHVERRDLGISGTKGREERAGLAYLIEQIEAGKVEAVYVVHISRLYRDQTLINALALGELFKEHGVIIVTPYMKLNLQDKMHMRIYRMEVERAADELELMARRLLEARDLKAKSGFYAGERLPSGYVIDEREKLPDGNPNPAYHAYQIYEPHAQVIRIIFEQLAIPGMTPTRVARYCKRQGIVFAPFLPGFDTPANLKSFTQSKRTLDGSWPIAVGKVRTIATNPVYIGWKVWSGEVIDKNVYPPLIDEQLFWTVQEKFNNGESRPKEERDPLLLAGLLFCGNHDVPHRMNYANVKPPRKSYYRCCDSILLTTCAIVTAYILDDPISEAVISQLTPPDGLPERMLQQYADEYEEAKARAASYRREQKRLEVEVESLRGNLIKEVMSVEQLQWLDEQIQQRLARIRDLADLENQPIGAMIGHPVPEQTTIESVRVFLKNLKHEWPDQPAGFKNAVLRLLLDRVTIWHDSATIRVKLTWRWPVGVERELLIHRPVSGTRKRWTKAELEIVREHYKTATPDELLSLLPGRTWESVRKMGGRLNLSRAEKTGGGGHRGKKRLCTSEEDELIRRYYAGEITRAEITVMTNRTIDGIRARARKLSLTRRPYQITWEWLDNKRDIPQKEGSSMPPI